LVLRPPLCVERKYEGLKDRADTPVAEAPKGSTACLGSLVPRARRVYLDLPASPDRLACQD